MRPVKQSLSAPGPSPWVPVDADALPMNIGFGVVVSGSVVYTVEHTFDNVFDSTVTPVAFPHPVVAAQSANKDGNYAFPVRAVRVNMNSGSGSLYWNVIQGLKG